MYRFSLTLDHLHIQCTCILSKLWKQDYHFHRVHPISTKLYGKYLVENFMSWQCTAKLPSWWTVRYFKDVKFPSGPWDGGVGCLAVWAHISRKHGNVQVKWNNIAIILASLITVNSLMFAGDVFGFWGFISKMHILIPANINQFAVCLTCYNHCKFHFLSSCDLIV